MNKSFVIISTAAEEIDAIIAEGLAGYNTIISQGDKPRKVWVKDAGPLVEDIDNSPVILIQYPKQITRFLWSAGSINIHQVNIAKRWPLYAKAVNSLKNRISKETLIRARGSPHVGGYGYYLRGSFMNFDSPIYATSSGQSYLDQKLFLIHPFNSENQHIITRELKSLRLIGFE